MNSVNQPKANVKLTVYQRDLLQAAIDCDSLNSSRNIRLQDLNRLANKGLLEPFDCKPNHSGRNVNVWFAITPAGRLALESAPK